MQSGPPRTTPVLHGGRPAAGSSLQAAPLRADDGRRWRRAAVVAALVAMTGPREGLASESVTVTVSVGW